MSNQIQSGESFVVGQLVTASNLNKIAGEATLLKGAISNQPAMTEAVSPSDELIISDTSGTSDLPNKVTVANLLGSGVPVVASSVTTNSITSDESLALTAPTVEFSGKVEFEGGSLEVVGDVEVSGNLKCSGAGRLQLPSGTSLQRPEEPEAGSIRYNTELGRPEVYNGTSWGEVSGGPFEATGGDIVIAPESSFTENATAQSDNGEDITITRSGHTVVVGQFVEVKTTNSSLLDGEFPCTEVGAGFFKVRAPFQIGAITSAVACKYRKAGGCKIHVYKTPGTHTFTTGPKSGYAWVLVVGGGGVGYPQGVDSRRNTDIGGPGGGVAEVRNVFLKANTTYTVIVGAKGQREGLGTFKENDANVVLAVPALAPYVGSTPTWNKFSTGTGSSFSTVSNPFSNFLGSRAISAGRGTAAVYPPSTPATMLQHTGDNWQCQPQTTFNSTSRLVLFNPDVGNEFDGFVERNLYTYNWIGMYAGNTEGMGAMSRDMAPPNSTAGARNYTTTSWGTWTNFTPLKLWSKGLHSAILNDLYSNGYNPSQSQFKNYGTEYGHGGRFCKIPKANSGGGAGYTRHTKSDIIFYQTSTSGPVAASDAGASDGLVAIRYEYWV